MKNSRYDFDHSKLEGVDVSIEISLKEYGLAWIEAEDEILFYYGTAYNDATQEYNRFDMARFDVPIDVEKEFDWADFDSLRSYSDPFDELSVYAKIFTLLLYYGFENVFGSQYWEGLTYEEIFLSESQMDAKRKGD